jgi:transposase
MKNYTRKTVFVGIDVHKKTYAITCIYGEEVKKVTMQASPKELVKYLKKHFPNASCTAAYEAGFSGFVLHRYLVDHGIDSIVVHAASIEISSRDKVKTDKRNSLKIATQLAAGRLKGIHIPSIEREMRREITRLRETFVKDKKRTGNRLKGLLHRNGLISALDETKVSKKWINNTLKDAPDNDLGFCIKVFATEWLDLDKKIKLLEKKLEEQAKEDHYLEAVYQSAPGIGVVNARVLANELEDMRHFQKEKGLFSFTGLTPSEHSSGEHKRLGHISRQGRSLLRKTLIQAAWVAIRKDRSLREIFERVSIKAGKKRAIVGIARRLIGRIRACFITESLYKIGYSQCG